MDQMNNKAAKTVEIYITLALNNVNFSFLTIIKKPHLLMIRLTVAGPNEVYSLFHSR